MRLVRYLLYLYLYSIDIIWPEAISVDMTKEQVHITHIQHAQHMYAESQY